MLFTKDVWVRAFKTGIEAMITYFLASIAGLSFTQVFATDFLIGLAFGVASAFITALLNAVLESLKANK